MNNHFSTHLTEFFVDIFQLFSFHYELEVPEKKSFLQSLPLNTETKTYTWLLKEAILRSFSSQFSSFESEYTFGEN